jgi:RHS repeat-associated protein
MRIPAVAALAVALLVPAPRAQAQIIEYYHLDATGNVLAVTNQAGQVVETHDYLPFGEELCGNAPCSGPAAGQPKRFTGKERDVETGLDYFGARYYRANLGRFTTVDPQLDAKKALFDPQRWNRYAYVSNNPLRYVDPDGREQAVVLGGRIYMAGLDGMPAGDQHAQNVVFAIMAAPAALVAAGLAAPEVLAAGSALLPTAYANAPKLLDIGAGIAEGASGAAPGSLSLGTSIAVQAERASESVALTAGQRTNLARFVKKLPKGNTGVNVDQLGEQVLFTAEVPGRVPGSKAVYQKAVNAAGETTAAVKTAFDPRGEVVHVKDKLTP